MNTTITYDAIRVGDTIRTTFADGTTMQDTVVQKGPATAWSRSGLVLAYHDSNTITLIHRAGPALPTEPGSVIMDVTTNDGATHGTLLRASMKWWWSVDGDSYYPAEIVSWTPGRIVPDGEPVTRGVTS